MHIMVVNFNLKGITEEEYIGLVEPIAPAFAGLPGLISKAWLANAEINTYGGVYGKGESGVRLRMVPAPGGVAFVEEKPAEMRQGGT